MHVPYFVVKSGYIGRPVREERLINGTISLCQNGVYVSYPTERRAYCLVPHHFQPTGKISGQIENLRGPLLIFDGLQLCRGGNSPVIQ